MILFILLLFLFLLFMVNSTLALVLGVLVALIMAYVANVRVGRVRQLQLDGAVEAVGQPGSADYALRLHLRNEGLIAMVIDEVALKMRGVKPWEAETATEILMGDRDGTEIGRHWLNPGAERDYYIAARDLHTGWQQVPPKGLFLAIAHEYRTLAVLDGEEIAPALASMELQEPVAEEEVDDESLMPQWAGEEEDADQR
jgi:hypothetical protein